MPGKYKGSDDRFAWILLFKNNPDLSTAYIAEPLLICNIHEENYSHNTTELEKSCIEIWDKIKSSQNFGKHSRLVEMDILRIKSQIQYTEEKKINPVGFMLYLFYKLRPYKIMRYIIRYLK